MKTKRYEVILSFYIYAPDDKDAHLLAEARRKKMERKEDNCPEVLAVNEIPFGSLEKRRVVE